MSHEDCPCKSVGLKFSLWSAATYGATERLKHLLMHEYANPSKEDDLRQTPLHFAAHHGREEVVTILLQAGADANAAGCGRTPLHAAAYGGHTSVVRMLLERGGAGASLEVADTGTGDGRTPLAKAAWQGHLDTVKLLLDAGARPMAKDAKGKTAAESAEAAGFSEVAALLRAATPTEADPA